MAPASCEPRHRVETEGVEMLVYLLPVMLLVALLLPPAPAAAADARGGAKISAERCAKCHGSTGKGDGEGLKKINADVTPIDWTNRAVMSKWSDQDLIKIIQQGGKAVGKSKIMPAYHGKLSDAEIAELVTYIRSLAKPQ